ncbi:MAG: hypothetical protein U1G07_21000 [Verrucomicrobiota bacterium]
MKAQINRRASERSTNIVVWVQPLLQTVRPLSLAALILVGVGLLAVLSFACLRGLSRIETGRQGQMEWDETRAEGSISTVSVLARAPKE